MSEKVLGYLLLVFGIIVIGLSTFSVYRVFSKQEKPVDLFLFDSIKIDFARFVPENPSSGNLTQELIPAEVLNAPINYGAHLMLMGFIASSGFKIASIGVTLLRPVNVKLKEEKNIS